MFLHCCAQAPLYAEFLRMVAQNTVYMRAYRKRKRDAINAYNRDWMRKYRARKRKKECSECGSKYAVFLSRLESWRCKKHFEWYMAVEILKPTRIGNPRSILLNALNKRAIKRELCRECGAFAFPHQFNEKDPLDVTWLCLKHSKMLE